MFFCILVILGFCYYYGIIVLMLLLFGVIKILHSVTLLVLYSYIL